MYGYWDRKDEVSGSLVDKAEGIGKIAGLIGIGIASRPYWSRWAGKAGAGMAQRITGRLSGQTLDNVVEEALGEEMSNPFFSLFDKVRGLVTSSVARTKRANTFFQEIGQYVEGDKSAFEAAKGTILKDIEYISKIGTTEDTDVDRFILSPKMIEHLTRRMEDQGVKFSIEYHKNAQRVHESIIAQTTKVTPTAEEINAFFYNKENKETLKKAFDHLWEKEQRRLSAINKFVDYGDDIIQVKGADLLNEGELKNAVENYLDRVGIARGDASRVDDLIVMAKKKWGALTDVNNKNTGVFINPPSPNRATQQGDSTFLDHVMEKFKVTTTGIGYNKKTKQAFSLARVRKERTDWVDTILDELQIPLIPFTKMAVPLKTFKFMSPTKHSVRFLGNIGADPELAREFRDRGFSPEALASMHGLGVDDRLLSITSGEFVDGELKNAGKLTFHTDINRIVSYEKRQSPNVKDIAAARGGSDKYKLLNLKGAEDSHSLGKRKLFSLSRKAGRAYYDSEAGGFRVVPRSTGIAGVAQMGALRSLYGDAKTVSLDNIHPALVAEWLQNKTPEDLTTIGVSTDTVRYALNYALTQAKQDRKSISPLLTSISNALNEGRLSLPKDTPLGGILGAMLDNSGDMTRLLSNLSDIHVQDQNLYGEIAPQLYRSIVTAAYDPQSFTQITRGRSGFKEELAANIFGQTGISEGAEKLQEGILSQAIREAELDILMAEVGVTDSNQLIAMLAELQANETGAVAPNLAGHALETRFSNLGLVVGGETQPVFNRFINELFEGTTNPANPRISRAKLGQFAFASNSSNNIKRNWLVNTTDATDQAKIVADFADALNAFESLKDSVGISQNTAAAAHLRQLTDLSNSIDLLDILDTRFSRTRPWQPEEIPIDPLNVGNYYTVTSQANSVYDAINMLAEGRGHELLKAQLQRGFGIGQFARSMVDPDAPLGGFGAAVQMLLTMPQRIAAEAGLGLNAADRLTTLRTLGGFYGKRLVPLKVGYELYKNYNANMHALGLPGIDDLSANFLANVNLNTATFKDMTGITSFNQWAVGTLPGLDQYFSPRSREEYQEYLNYGDEEVRSGRGWLVGSRDPFMGGSVKYTRPNFYRRWRSHWTEADNVDISNPMYSFLPNLQNPLAPLNLLINPDWWVEKHRDDRPYIPGGRGYAPNLWAMHDNYVTINSRKEFGPLAIGELGGGYPTAMSGGDAGITYDMRSQSYLLGALGGNAGAVLGSQGTGGNLVGKSMMGPNPTSAMMLYNGTYQTHTSNLEAAGEPIRLGLYKGDAAAIEKFSVAEMGRQAIDLIRTHAGLYGAIMQRLPGYPADGLPYEEQDPSAARSFSRTMWMGEYGELPFGSLGSAKEFFRRLIQPDSQSYDAYNPLPNNMPSWLPEKFHRGDPYMRVPGIGELQLPGDAWERTHPWVAPLRVRGSAIGLSEKELIQKWLNPLEEIDSDDGEDIVEFGSAAHLQVQRQLREIGALVGAEVSIYDEVNNLTGTVDAVVRGANGLEVVEIKTQGEKSWGSVPEKYKDQLTFYMATLGISQGKIAFVNRDNPQEVRFHQMEFDPYRWQSILNRIETARSTMNNLVDQGLVSPFESYDLVSRIEILAKVAPNSAEFRQHVEHALGGGLGGFEKQRVNAAIKQADKMTQDYNLYSYKYDRDWIKANFEVLGISNDGEIVTDRGTVKLAGIELDPQAIAIEGIEAIYARFGIQVGDSFKATLIEGRLNPEVMQDVTTPVIVGDLNSKLVDLQYARWNDEETTRDPTASRARYGNSLVGKLWEQLVHSDNMLTNKFMRVRSALEQFERGEVYGTDKMRWNDPINTLVIPTINSFINKDPLTAGIQSGIAAAMFVRTNSPRAKIPYLRSKVAAGAAVAGAGLSILKWVKEGFGDSLWTPKRYREQAAFDEYWDIIKYLKFTAVAEKAKKLAILREGVNIDELTQGEQRSTVGLGPWSVLAIDAQRKAKRTMYGFDEATGSLSEALSTLPQRQQQIAQEIIMNGSLEEKQKFYDLLPDAQRRVLGKFLNVERLPDRPVLTEYFRTHFLPNPEWAGWGRDVDLEDIETRSADLENVQISKPNRAKVSKARSFTNDVPIPRMDNPTAGNIRRQINNLLASGGWANVDMDMKVLPADSSSVNVNIDLFEDQTDKLLEIYRNE